MLKYFDTQETDRFARELARDILSALGASTDKKDAKFMAKAEKILLTADQRVRQFKTAHPMNFYKRSKLANAFLWSLKDAGCSADYANELTEWLTYRL